MRKWQFAETQKRYRGTGVSQMKRSTERESKHRRDEREWMADRKEQGNQQKKNGGRTEQETDGETRRKETYKR